MTLRRILDIISARNAAIEVNLSIKMFVFSVRF